LQTFGGRELAAQTLPFEYEIIGMEFIKIHGNPQRLSITRENYSGLWRKHRLSRLLHRKRNWGLLWAIESVGHDGSFWR
jgi:hypothetical protein